MTFFLSDTHFNETRITPELNLFFRPFKSVEEQNEFMIARINEVIGENDEFYHLGDVSVDVEGISWMDRIRCKNGTLILGNYDVDKAEKLPILKEKFKLVLESMHLKGVGNDKSNFYLNHYPTKAVADAFNIVGHIHSLWKVQPNMVNVGVDAWHFRPVSFKEILFIKNAIENHYDKNVFPCCDSFIQTKA